MAKVDVNSFEKVTSNADLKTNIKPSGSKIVQVYDVPLEWVNIIQVKTGYKSISGYVRNALLEKLKREGLI